MGLANEQSMNIHLERALKHFLHQMHIPLAWFVTNREQLPWWWAIVTVLLRIAINNLLDASEQNSWYGVSKRSRSFNTTKRSPTFGLPQPLLWHLIRLSKCTLQRFRRVRRMSMHWMRVAVRTLGDLQREAA